MKCLREKTLDQLLSVPIRPPEFGFAFGPSIDGVVIDGGDYVPPPPGSPAAQAQAQASTAAGNGLGGEAGIAAAGGWGTPGQLENIGEFMALSSIQFINLCYLFYIFKLL